MAKNQMTEQDWWKGLMGMTKEQYQQKQWAKGKDALGVLPPKSLEPPALPNVPELTEQQKNKKIIDDWMRESQEQGPLSSDDLFRMNAEQQRKMRNPRPQPVKNTPYSSQPAVQSILDVDYMTQAQRDKLVNDWIRKGQEQGPLSGGDLQRMNDERQKKIYNQNLAANIPFEKQKKLQPYPYAALTTEEQFKKAREAWAEASAPFTSQYPQGWDVSKVASSQNESLQNKDTNDTLIKNDPPTMEQELFGFLARSEPPKLGFEITPPLQRVTSPLSDEQRRNSVANDFNNTWISAPGSGFSEEIQEERDAPLKR